MTKTSKEPNGRKDSTPSPLSQVARVAPNMALDRLRFLAGSFSYSPGKIEELEIPIRSTVSCRLEPEERLVTAVVFFEFNASPPTPGIGDDHVSISAQFELRYTYPAEGDYEEEDLLVFGRINGVYNSWPYWREYAQSSTVRLGLPSLTMPLLTASQAAAMAEASLPAGQELQDKAEKSSE